MENSNKNQTNSQNGSNGRNNNNAGHQKQNQNNSQDVPVVNPQVMPNVSTPNNQAVPIVSEEKNLKENKAFNQAIPIDKNQKVTPIKPSVDNMEKNKLNIIIGVVVMVLILVGAAYLGKNIKERQDEKKKAESINLLNKINCSSNDKYFVVTRSGILGDDIIIKYKTEQNQDKIECIYVVEEGDFELLNNPLDKAYVSQSFLYLRNNLLMLGRETGTSRDLIVYDLDKKDKVYMDSYNTPFFDLEDDVFTYWRRTNDVPNKENCSRVEEYSENGGAQIQGKIELNLNNLKDKKFIEFRCVQGE